MRCIALAGVLALGLGACGGDQGATETAATPAGDSASAKPGRAADEPAILATDAGPAEGSSKPAGMEGGALGSRVKSALTRQPGLRALSIDVDAASGAVTLYGTANTPAQRELAAQLALGVDGVKSVTNHLIILKET
jgi:hyperosmotically inducible periplasmic protein